MVCFSFDLFLEMNTLESMETTFSTPDIQRSHPLILFIHIPKTAGTTLSFILEQHYGPEHVFACHPERWVSGKTPEDFKDLPAQEREQYQVIRGHFVFGIHENLRDLFTYVAVFREPVDRVVSHYYYARRRKDHYLHKRIVAENLSLKDYVAKGLSVEMDNGQTRMVVGQAGLEVPFGECPPEFLETAKHNLKTYFGAVGTSERFDDMLVLLKEQFGWSMPFYINWKVTQNRPNQADISPDVVKVIHQYNAIDLEIHRYANELLDELIAKHVRFFKLKLFVFKLLNRLYGYGFRLSRKLPKSLQANLDKHLFKLVWQVA